MKQITSNCLTCYELLTPYGEINLARHWLGQWPVARCHCLIVDWPIINWFLYGARLWQHMATLDWVSIALGYDLFLYGATPLLDPVMLNNQGGHVTVNGENFRWISAKPSKWNVQLFKTLIIVIQFFGATHFKIFYSLKKGALKSTY